jgi:hypothetical protein
MIVLRIDIHFEVRKRDHIELTIINQNNMKLLHIAFSQERQNLVLTLIISCEQPSFLIGTGSMPLPRKFHEEHY